MKIAKRTLAFVLCILMLATSMINEGSVSLLQTLKASAIEGHEQNYNDARVDLDFNKGWKFAFSEDTASYLKGFDDSKWEDVDLPHDFSIEQGFSATGTEAESGNIPGGTGWYRKWFNLYDYYEGSDIIINFDGVYQHAYVYVNGKYVGENHYGYNSFSFEISDYLLSSSSSLNLIAVKVVNELPSSRWYSGSGIYRDVTITIANPLHISYYDPQVTTPEIENGDGTIKAEIPLHNHTAITKKVTVEATVLDSHHNAVSDTVTSSLITVSADTEYTVTLEPEVASPKLWSVDSPNLYKLKTVVKNEEGKIIDEYHTTFGYRYIKWDADEGFSLNGELIKIKGVSLHHDQGALGAIQEYDAIYRQVSILKDMGCNAIRTTHNTASRVLIEICNELGMLVMEEFFDGWDASKNYNNHDFSEYFNQTIASTNKLIGAKGQKWFEFVVEQTVLRDRHDPCIIAWGVGNELYNLTVEKPESTVNYEAIVKSIVKITDELDPDIVLVQGNNKSHAPATMLVDSYMDVIGGNYNPYYWSYLMGGTEDERSSKPFVATEAASANNSRGVYYTMGKDDATLQCTAYDTYAVDWGTEASEAWYYVATNDFFSGEFVWTGFDYIGETTPWMNYSGPNENLVPNSSYFGVIDTAGFAKDSYYLYRSLWNEESTTLHLVPGSWNEENLYVDDNGYVNVAVYSNAKKIELLLNGSVIATATSTVTTTDAGYKYRTWTESVTDSANCAVGSFYTGEGEDFYPQFSVKYAEGELSVKAYDESNVEITNTVGLTTAASGDATQIVAKIWQDKNTFVADGSRYIYVEFEARDADGNFMNDYNGTLSFEVDDQSARYAKIVGVDNGNPATADKFQQDSVILSGAEAEFKMFNGRALVILKTTEEEGTINFTATASEGETSFSTNGVTVTSVKETGVQLTDEFEEVINQNGDAYEPTLFDKYEMVKHHINELEPPKPEEGGSGGTDSGDTGGSTVIDKYQIFIPDSSASQHIPDGEYVINSNNVLMSGRVYGGWAVDADSTIQNPEWASEGDAYTYESFDTTDGNVFIITHQGDNKYYIQHKKTGRYLTVNSYMLVLGSEPHAFNVELNANGSFHIDSNDTYYVSQGWGPYEFKADETASTDLWLYSNPSGVSPTPPATELNKVEIYLADSTVSEGSIKDGDYVLFNKDWALSDEVLWNYVIYGSDDIYNITSPTGYSNQPEDFETIDSNILTFTHQGNNTYYIKNKSTGLYVNIGEWEIVYSSTPQAITVTPRSDGSVLLSNDDFYAIHLVYTEGDKLGTHHYYSETPNEWFTPDKNENSIMWLYSVTEYSYEREEDDEGDEGDEGGNSGTTTPTVNPNKQALYNILNEGIKYNYASYERKSYEKLLDALEAGVDVYKKDGVTDAELTAATKAIRDAINALKLDVKKINGTLFKYGYNNSTGAIDYSDGGFLMNNISVKQMKTAILANPDLVSQIKDVIGYDDPDMGWAGNRADEVLDEAAELYAKVYTLMFTGTPVNGLDYDYNQSPVNPSAANQDLTGYVKIPLTLWNVWTKANTHGANDPNDWQGNPIHDGASVQGLASATLDKGLVTSHAAYQQELSYANEGPTESYDVEYYKFGFDTGSGWKSVKFEYLSGISVYFPDLFSREVLDASGNVTTSTTGKFSKYYWDTEFPMFISTDEYGVNTYHYDSADTRYLIQSDFDDVNHTVDMELNEVENWTISGPNNETQSGFFPFNYKEGTTNYNGEKAVYHYGFTFEHNFYIPKGGKHVNGEDVIFSFSGDDDVLVYIDGVLVLDNGGLHGARAATINFTNCSVNYQYAIDITDGELKGGEYQTTYSYNDYIEHPDTVGYNADTIAAINKLHEVISDGEVHTLNFFYLERGASDSNCKISFNLSETSEDVKIIDQNLTLDYGLPVEYNITTNNNISKAALDNGVKIEYIGICAVNEDYTPTYTFEKPQISVAFEDNKTYTVEGMKYGTCTIDNKGNVSYTLKSTNMAKSENFYVVAKITGDPTYAEEVVYYQVEKTTFIPATAIYYEDTFETITYTNGTVPTGYDNTKNEFGIWKKQGTQPTTLKQTADLTDSEANPYGYESGYLSFAEYSGDSIHYVDVATKNNPNKKFSGGTGSSWPTVKFDFTGTGFDLISITDCTTGAFSIEVSNADTNTVVARNVVDTFYGYDYGRLYADENGIFTLDDSGQPLFRAENGNETLEARYYDEDGKITKAPHYYDELGEVTDVAHYYDADGKVVETETSLPAYAYSLAYGWVVAEEGSKETLYQIPVIKVTDLEYGHYNVVITPTFTSNFGHASVADDGTNYYRVYFDAIKIYSPAGHGDNIKDSDVRKAYATDDENYPNYLELKDMLIGADSLSETDTQGVIFIDGIAALDNDIETYKNAGPNNELYLAKDQAVAFEIWATSVPTDVQLGVKLACGEPKLTISYANKSTDVDIETATDLYYSLNTVLPNDAKLTWKQVKGADGNNYYTTGTVVVQNTGKQDSVLSITNLKWTFSQTGGKGYFRIPTQIEDEFVVPASTTKTQAAAYSLMRMRTAALDVEQVQEPEVVQNEDGSSTVTVKLKTSSEVASVVVTDENGKELSCEFTATPVEGEDEIEWIVTFTATEAGTHTYTVAGAYENGYVDSSKVTTFTATIEAPPVIEPPTTEPDDEPTTEPDDEPTTEPDDETATQPDNSDEDTFESVILEVLNWVYNKLVKVFNFLVSIFKNF